MPLKLFFTLCFFFLLNTTAISQNYAKKEIKIANQFIPIDLDDYPVTDSMFYNFSSISFEKTESYSQWFANESLQEILVFELYTDNLRQWTFHFDNQELTQSFLQNIPFQIKDMKDKQQSFVAVESEFSYYVKAAKQIPATYFVSNKGFRMGDNIQKALKEYGNPSIIINEANISIYKWKMGNCCNSMTIYAKADSIIGIIICRDMI